LINSLIILPNIIEYFFTQILNTDTDLLIKNFNRFQMDILPIQMESKPAQ